MDSDASGLFAEEKEQIDEEWHEAFDKLVSQGRAPSSIIATIRYITEDKSQKQIGKEMDVTQPTMRKLIPALVALGPIEEVDYKQSKKTKKTSVGEYSNRVADEMGWEEGEEYRRNGGAASMKKAGWVSLYDRLSESE